MLQGRRCRSEGIAAAVEKFPPPFWHEPVAKDLQGLLLDPGGPGVRDARTPDLERASAWPLGWAFDASALRCSH